MSNKYIRDLVFPLIIGKKNEDGYSVMSTVVGTGFIIGNNGFAMTAAHVIEQLLDESGEGHEIIGLFANEGQWIGAIVDKFEKHASEDVAILKFKEFKKESFFKILKESQYSSCEYHCWGYPISVAKELSKLYQGSSDRPDLVYTQGYIRRRISRDLFPTMIFRGTHFYELSETIGHGNSGGPIFLRNSDTRGNWNLIGIYVGESTENGNVGYGVRAESFVDWKPTILNRTIFEEFNIQE